MGFQIISAFLLFFLFNCISGISQQTNIAFKNITINEGLSQNSVVAIAEDDFGFLWFATQDGLNRFDGRNFLIFPRTFDDITTTVNSQLGKIIVKGHELWLVTKGGKLEVFDLYTQTFSTISHLGKEQKTLPPVSDVHIDQKNNLWIGTEQNGLYLFNPEENVILRFGEKSGPPYFLNSNNIRSIFEDSQQNLWILTDAGVNKISNGHSIPYSKSINTNVITEDPEQTLWLGTFGKGILYKKKGSEKFESFQGFGQQLLPKDLIVESICADEENRIWVGTYGKGLYVINSSDSTITHLLPDKRNPFTIGFQDVLSIIKDKNGGIWIGTDGGGVSFYSKKFNNFNRITIQNVNRDISIEQIRAISTDQEGVVWLGTSGQGLTSFSPSQNSFNTYYIKPFQDSINISSRVVSILADEEGDLWIGTQGSGIVVMDRYSKKVRKWFSDEAMSELEKIPVNTVWSFLPGKKNRVWAATRHSGLLLIDKDKGLLKQYQLSSEIQDTKINGNNVLCIIQVNDSTLALSIEDSGIYLLNIPSENFIAVSNNQIEKILSYGTTIKCFYFHKGWLWAGTSGKGIIVTHLETGITHILNEKDGLPNNMIYGILPERDGVVWASSNKGIFRLSYSISPQEIKIRQLLPYTISDGLQSNEFNTGAYHRTNEGVMIFGGISGINYFHPEVIEYERNELSVVLTGAMIGNRPIESDTIITYKNQLELSYKQNSISFNYTALDFISPEKLHYQYKLEGYEEDWVEVGNRNYTAYNNLPPGDYIFKVKVSDNFNKDASPTSLAITIAAPFWMQWWFRLFIAATSISFLYGFYRYRINQLLQVQKIKNSISADLHDDIGSRLTNIQYLTAISINNNTSGMETNNYLKGIEQEVQASAEALDEIVWNIKMTDESLEDIVAKMRRYASEVLENDDILYNVKVNTEFTRKKMSMRKRRELFLVFKELLNNIRKHSQAKNVDIQISIQNKMFYLALKDNGKGFDPLKATDRNGIRNIRERVEKWHGIFHILSNEGEGTFVELFIPFDKRSI